MNRYNKGPVCEDALRHFSDLCLGFLDIWNLQTLGHKPFFKLRGSTTVPKHRDKGV